MREFDVPKEIMEIAKNDHFISSLSGIEEISAVCGGVAHSVYKINSGQERFYLKIRRDHFVQVPQITCNPADIAIEHKALRTFHEVAPENFPRVLSFNQDKFYMVLSDAIPSGQKLEDLFLNARVTPGMLFNLGTTLRKIHDLSVPCIQGLREDDDRYKYEELLQHRFGYRHNLVLDELSDQLRRLGNRQLVLGDGSPKNIGANNNGEFFIFFDLETAHKGDAVFDYGYLLGHIAIHTFTSSQIAIENIQAFVKGYGPQTFNEETTKRIALGIMLYRLGGIIPYPLHLNAEEKQEAQHKIETVLPLNLALASWPEVINLLQFHEQN